MTDYLMFTLYSPLSSWGDIAVGEVRSSNTHPGRSAIFGLIAAALGIRRKESSAINNLHADYKLGVKVLSAGNLINDFHTIQAARSQRNVVFRTRADELNANPDSIGTLISSREYRSDALYVIAVWSQSESQSYKLLDIKQALESPVFVPYLGRKSCPLAWNLSADIISNKLTLRDAFEAYNVNPLLMNLGFFGTLNFEMCFWDDCIHHGFENEKVISTERYDAVIDSFRRQFGPRPENMAIIKTRKEQ
jgi:CRISPR system Cascade subunit CasD